MKSFLLSILQMFLYIFVIVIWLAFAIPYLLVSLDSLESERAIQRKLENLWRRLKYHLYLKKEIIIYLKDGQYTKTHIDNKWWQALSEKRKDN